MLFSKMRLSFFLSLFLLPLVVLPSSVSSQISVKPISSVSKTLKANWREAQLLAQQPRQTDKTDDAIKQLQQKLTRYQQLGDRAEEAFVLMELAAAYYSRFQDNQAVALANQAVAVTQTMNNPQESLRTLSFLVGLHRQLKQWQSAIVAQEQIVENARKINQREVAIQLLELGRLHGEKKNYKKAIEIYQNSFKAAKSLEFEDQNNSGVSIKVEALKALVEIHLRLNRTEEVKNLQQILAWEEEAFSLWLQTQRSRVDEQTPVPSDEPLLQAALVLYKQLKDTRSQAETLLQLGQTQVSVKSPSQAFETLQAALNLANQNGYVNLEARALVSLESWLSTSQAVMFWQRVANQAQSRQENRIYYFALGKLAALYEGSGQIEQARVIKQQQEALPSPVLPPPIFRPPTPLLYRVNNGVVEYSDPK